MATAPKTTEVQMDVVMKLSDVKEMVRTLISIDKPACLWGAPGVGKSDAIFQVGIELGYVVKDVRAVLMDAVDVHGLPRIDEIEDRVRWAIPEFFPGSDHPPTLIFLDELTRASSMVQNALFQLILGRQLGQHKLASQHRIVSANNRETDGGGTTRMHAGLANRFTHIDVRADLNDWTTWAAGADIDPMLLGFLRFRPNLLHDFQPKEHAFPTPRSWATVSRILGTASRPEIEFALIAGTVGRAAAVEFTAFSRMFRSLPNIDTILKDPAKAGIPNNIATLYATAAALARRAELSNLGNIVAYVDRSDFPKEFAVFTMKDAVTRDKGLTASPAFGGWFARNQGLL